MRRIRVIIAIILLPLLFGVVSCSSKNQQLMEGADRTETDWPISSPEAQGMDSALLDAMIKEISEKQLGNHSVQIIRNGVLVLDAYIPPFKEGEKHNIYSCTKSIISILIGIALDQGYIESLDQKVLDFFPERRGAVKNLSEDKENMRLHHLLTMSTGLESKDSYVYRWVGLTRMKASSDWAGYILDLPMVAEPGSRFDYSNMSSHLLSAIITKTTGKSALDFGRENLFGPLGITDIKWPLELEEQKMGYADMNVQAQERVKTNIGWANLELRAPDLAKIGQLVLNDGMWEGRQIVSSDYLKAATSPQIRAETQQGFYGFQWWLYEPGVFTALGYEGQFLIVTPQENLIVVFTSKLAEHNTFQPYHLYMTYIRPACSPIAPDEKK